MPRRARITLPNTPVHLIQRGNNRQACFFSDDDYKFYLECLREYSKTCECDVHAYVLMTNHVHLLVTPKESNSTSMLMKKLGQRYVQYINRTYQRSGTLWEGRYRSCVTSEESYVMSCYRYIELNPVRANMVEHPAEYKWSSYRRNAQGEKSDLIKPHSLYLSIGNDETRYERYRQLFRVQLESSMINEIRSATNGNYALGSDRFKAQVAEVLGRRVIPGKPGRPKKDDK